MLPRQDEGPLPLDAAPETDDEDEVLGQLDWHPADRAQHAGAAVLCLDAGGGAAGEGGSGAALPGGTPRQGRLVGPARGGCCAAHPTLTLAG